jgi:hypothetical protein
MEHFSEQAWIDFVREVSPSNGKSGQVRESGSRAELESHLLAGCSDCKATFKIWKQVYGIASHEREYCPPEPAIRMAKAAFAMTRRENAAESLVASLVFDSFSRPILAGVRSTTAAARQLVYDAAGLTIDMRFDRAPKSSKVQLIGQILDAERRQTVLANLPVVLSTGQGVLVADGQTSQSGEFHLEFEEQDELKLAIWVHASKVIRIALANLGNSTAARRLQGRTDIGNQ